jgi:histidyl-tRNA synthetase
MEISVPIWLVPSAAADVTTTSSACLGRDVPACGFLLGLDASSSSATERAGSRSQWPAAVWTSWSPFGTTTASEALALAGELAAAFESTCIRRPTTRQAVRALPADVSFVTIVGDDERAAGTVSIKDLRSGEQQRMPRAEVAAYILRTSSTS